jgi:hypothetical protein
VGAINYGPWDRLDGNEPFVAGKGPKPPGAAFYPKELTKERFEAAIAANPDLAPGLRSPYTIVLNGPNESLASRPYSAAFLPQLEPVVVALRLASTLTPNAALRSYLHQRANGLITDDFARSDELWLDVSSDVDIVIGPIETYEDELMGIKTAYTCYALVKDAEWTQRLSKYEALLGDLQRELPVPAEYKAEAPGGAGKLGVYDAVYYGGEANAGAKTIALNLPNDERIQLERGTRRLQFKNAMRAKFDTILMPIVEVLLDEQQQPLVSFDAFFDNTMFHEIAHGLGIKKVVKGSGTVREALQERADAIEEAKADVLGLSMVTRLHDRGELVEPSLESHYVTFLAGILRSVRFGASSAHGQANLAQLRYLEEQQAFSRDATSGRYRVDVSKMRASIDALAGMLLRLQGDGDYEGARQWLQAGEPSATLAEDLGRLDAADVPVDVVWQQGYETLGLEPPDIDAIDRSAASPPPAR